MSIAKDAPRLSASSPIVPIPAKRSSAGPPSRGARTWKRELRIRARAGRTSSPAIVKSFAPRADPPVRTAPSRTSSGLPAIVGRGALAQLRNRRHANRHGKAEDREEDEDEGGEPVEDLAAPRGGRSVGHRAASSMMAFRLNKWW